MLPKFRIIAEAIFSPVRACVAVRDFFCSARNHRLVRAHRTVQFLHESWVDNFSDDRHLITIDEGAVVRGQLLIFPHAGSIKIGKWTYIGAGSRIWSASEVVIGDHVLISHSVEIHDTDSHPTDWNERREHYLDMLQNGHSKNPPNIRSQPIHIGNDVWIGFGVKILRGVTIGDGAIIAAGTLVNRDVPPWTLGVGHPIQIKPQAPKMSKSEGHFAKAPK